MKDEIKTQIERAVMIVGFAFMFGLMFMGEDMRGAVGSSLAFLCGPLAESLPFHVVIFILASATGLYASIIQKYTINWDKMREIQERAREFQKEFREAQKSDDKKALKKIEKKRAQMMHDQGEMSKQQFVPMGYTIIVTIPVWLWVWWYVGIHTGASAVQPVLTTIMLPISGLKEYTAMWMGFMPYWMVWYILCSICISQVIRKVLNAGV